MKDAHKGRGIQNVEFDKVAHHVITTMEELGVPTDLIREVGELLETTRGDIVQWIVEILLIIPYLAKKF